MEFTNGQGMTVRVQFKAHPMVGRWTRSDVEAGQTVGDVVASLADPEKAWRVLLTRDGVTREIDPAEHVLKLMDGDELVIRPSVGFQLALGALSSVLIGAGLSATAATIVAAGLIAAVSIGAYLLVNKLFGADTDPKKLRQDKANPTISGVFNAVPEPGAALPVVFGRINMAPMKSATGYTHMKGQQAFRVERMTWGPGPVALESLKIGTTSIDKFQDVEVQFRNVDETLTRAALPGLDDMDVEFLNDGDPMTLYTRDIFEDQDGARLEEDVRVIRTTPANTRAATVRFFFDGLVNVTGQNQKKQRKVRVRVSYREAGTSEWTVHTIKTYKNKTTARFWLGERIVFPSVGEWDVSITRLTFDSDNTQVRDDAYLHSILSENPGSLPSPSGIAEVAIRIRATNQIQGQLDPINGVVKRMLPIWNGSSFSAPAVTRHPADAYIYALRGDLRKRPVDDDGIDLATIKAWKDAYPDWTFDYVHTGDTRLREFVRQILAPGLVVPGMMDGKHSLITDKSDQPPVQIFTPRNSSGASLDGSKPPEVHGLRIMFFSEDAGWEEDELVVYAPGYTELTANERYIETISVPGLVRGRGDDITNIAKFARYHLAQVFNRREEMRINVELDHLVVQRGDPVVYVSHMLRNSYCEGRIRELAVSGDDVTSISLDAESGLTDGTPVFIQVRGSSGVIQHFEAEVAGSGFTGVADSGVRDYPAGSFTIGDIEVGDLAIVYEAETEPRKWLVGEIGTDFRESAQLVLVDATQAPLDALDADLPEYDPKTLPVYEPIAPGFAIEYDGDQMVVVLFWSMVSPSDGQRYRVSLEDVLGNPIGVYEGADTTARFPVQDVFAEAFVARLYAQRPSGVWGREIEMPVNTATAFDAPDSVEGFGSRVVGDTITLTWDDGAANIDYYIVRFQPVTTGASWASAVPIVPKVRGTRVDVPAQNGTYLIKPVTFQDMEAIEAALVVVTSIANGLNVIETLDFHPTFDGTLSDGLAVTSGELVFASDTDLLTIADLVVIDDILTYGRTTLTATYEASDVVDLGEVDTARLSVEISATATLSSFDLLAEPDLLTLTDLLGGADGEWDATVQIATTDDDPSGSPTWSDWQDLVVGEYRARAFKARIELEVFNPQLVLTIAAFSLSVDMPDRIVRGADLTCTVSGYTVTFDPVFRVPPTVLIDGQGMATGDYSQVTGKSKSGFTVTFYDDADAAVERVFDYAAIGYGRED